MEDSYAPERLRKLVNGILAQPEFPRLICGGEISAATLTLVNVDFSAHGRPRLGGKSIGQFTLGDDSAAELRRVRQEMRGWLGRQRVDHITLMTANSKGDYRPAEAAAKLKGMLQLEYEIQIERVSLASVRAQVRKAEIALPDLFGLRLSKSEYEPVRRALEAAIYKAYRLKPEAVSSKRQRLACAGSEGGGQKVGSADGRSRSSSPGLAPDRSPPDFHLGQGFKGVHTVRIKPRNGRTTRWYQYCWRGGPLLRKWVGRSKLPFRPEDLAMLEGARREALDLDN